MVDAPVPPPPPPKPTESDPLNGAATVAVVASASGFVIPVLGPVVGVIMGYVVLWRRRRHAPEPAGRQAAIAVVVGVAALALPAMIVSALRIDDWTIRPLVGVVLGVVVAITGALHLSGAGPGATAATVVGALAATAAVAVVSCLLAIAVAWLFVLLIREIFAAMFGVVPLLVVR